jgi:2,3-bisphosphoglycerate-dependent phosphoglycerate mutase
MSARLLLVRHGEIDANLAQRWHGSTDSRLTARGHEQVRRLAAHLARTHPGAVGVHTSPLERAQETARPIAAALNVPLALAPALAEFGIGVLENELYADLAGRLGFFEQIAANPDWAPSGGESLGAVAARIVTAWRDIAAAHPAAEVVVVSHGAATAAGLAMLLDGDPRGWTRYHQHNTGLSELELGREPRLLSFDRVDHLT